MTDIASSLASSSSAAQTSPTTSKADRSRAQLTTNFENFLTLFIAQIKHQDPLEPMKSSEFTNSLANLSSVEQGVNQNSNLEKIIALMENDRNFGSPVSYLDKEIEFSSPVIKIKDGSAQFSYKLDQSPAEVYIVISDTNGKAVYNGSGGRDVGKNIIKWDGKDISGNQLPDGNYIVSVSYLDDEKKPVQVTTTTSGRVTEANIEDADVILFVEDLKVTQDKVLSIKSTQGG